MRGPEGDPFGETRGRLLGLAYRMLGSRVEAEDVLQDAWVKTANAAREIENPEAFYRTVVTRLCIDRMKSARARREVYVGPWLPEPILDADAISPETTTELAQDLSYALLMTLEKLTAAERAAFLLHDVFDTPYAEIAEALGQSEASCRQLASRARRAVKTSRQRRRALESEHEALLKCFASALASGDASALAAYLTDDAIAYTDGGGVKVAALNPVCGAMNVARFYCGVAAKQRRNGGSIRFELTRINGAPSFIVYVDGVLDQTVSIEIAHGKIASIYAVRNPQKLAALTPA